MSQNFTSFIILLTFLLNFFRKFNLFDILQIVVCPRCFGFQCLILVFLILVFYLAKFSLQWHHHIVFRCLGLFSTSCISCWSLLVLKDILWDIKVFWILWQFLVLIIDEFGKYRSFPYFYWLVFCPNHCW
jgi:hypothetical protein